MNQDVPAQEQRAPPQQEAATPTPSEIGNVAEEKRVRDRTIALSVILPLIAVALIVVVVYVFIRSANKAALPSWVPRVMQRRISPRSRHNYVVSAGQTSNSERPQNTDEASSSSSVDPSSSSVSQSSSAAALSEFSSVSDASESYSS
jgi:predicted PurR-regulated permease PerM